MSVLEFTIATAFWVSAALVVYAYAIYPVVIWLFSRFVRYDEPCELNVANVPAVSILIAAHNEEAVIEARLQNALASNYPGEKLEIVVGSDGSSDRTTKIVRTFAERGVRLLEYSENRGKASVLNDAMEAANGEIVVLSDANTHFDSSAIRKLVRWFQQPDVGVVCGKLCITDVQTGKNVDSLYWRYETFLKRCEGRLGAILGSNGAIYAIRKDRYVRIPSDTIVDDFVIPLLAKQNNKCRIIFDDEANAFEESAPSVTAEFNRRARIGAGGFQAIGLLWKLLNPRRGWVAFTFFSHKILRWLCPFFLLAMLITNVFLLQRSVFLIAFVVQLFCYALAFAGARLSTTARFMKPIRLATMFVGMNAALLVGFSRWFWGRQKGTWSRTARLPQAKEDPCRKIVA